MNRLRLFCSYEGIKCGHTQSCSPTEHMIGVYFSIPPAPWNYARPMRFFG